jgi:hypothetical protein
MAMRFPTQLQDFRSAISSNSAGSALDRIDSIYQRAPASARAGKRSKLHGHGVGRLEVDAADVAGQPVGCSDMTWTVSAL